MYCDCDRVKHATKLLIQKNTNQRYNSQCNLFSADTETFFFYACAKTRVLLKWSLLIVGHDMLQCIADVLCVSSSLFCAIMLCLSCRRVLFVLVLLCVFFCAHVGSLVLP